jgi:hypothetical protein
MARDEGMALCPWGALGGGNFTTKEKRENNEQGRNFGPASDKHIKVSEKLEAVAKSKNTAITSIALAYVRSKYPFVYPIVGGRKIEHLKGNIEALALELSAQEIDEIDSAVDFEVGFPMNFLFEFGGGEYYSKVEPFACLELLTSDLGKYNTNKTSADVGLLAYAGNLEVPPHQQPVKPHGLQGYGRNQ